MYLHTPGDDGAKEREFFTLTFLPTGAPVQATVQLTVAEARELLRLLTEGLS